MVEKECGCAATGDGNGRAAPLLDGSGENSGDGGREIFRQGFGRGEFMPFAVHHGQVLSCQVRPSRSISAIEEDGPHVPAV